MKWIKKIYVLATAFTLCLALLTACNGNSAPSSDSSDIESSTGTSMDTQSQESVSNGGSSQNNYDPTVTGTYEDGSTPEFSGTRLRLTVNDNEEVIIALYDNTAVDALLECLPLENLSFFDLSGIEKPIERLDELLSLGNEEPGYDPVTGEMVIYRPWANFTIFYGDFRYSPELVPLGKVESGLEVLSSKIEDFTGVLELMESKYNGGCK